ncbi:MAG TPA: bifunctional UDP-3-O-[3-hydroxymyristoyl] N-acetylglucosamine deacetylase/3-hydroxyacyl-ACP dehydratase [Methylomirabilota bacterium]|nr:bifunctional UDP-3-O-[3-hydroxymyristoyl] N-acetylglucosamine deacetylase/3-hydroxyacyl-ACP dehydratase [Methylomirabilota bacterium]
MAQQQTLRRSVSFSGIGLHSGNRVNMTFAPGAPNSGIRFRRMDLDGKPELEARADLVVDTNRSTTLGRGALKVQTVEHVLAAFAGCEIDNAIIEIDANEPPIADGSAREYVRMIDSAGAVPMAEAREPYRVKEAIELQVGEATMSVFPHDKLKISCTSADRGNRFTEFYTIELSPDNWRKELAHARTFCFFEEIEYLYRSGLIKGGSLENAVVIRDDAVLTNEPLRYPEEFVRHKILDVIGDLSLLGCPLQGHVIAIRPSHQSNVELVKAIQVQMRKPLVAAQTFAPPPQPLARERSTVSEKGAEKGEGDAGSEMPVRDGATLDIMQVMKILPHRPPFLMVDKVTRIEGNKITAVKQVTMNEPHFDGHFPNHPIMPGVLQLEAIAQVAGILMMRQAENAGKLAYFMSAESVKWRKPVRPGDTLVIDVEMTKARGKIGKAKGICSVDGEPVSEAEVTFVLMDR